MNENHRIVQFQLGDINPHQILVEDFQKFNELCRTRPDFVPEFVQYADSQIAYMVGFWWLALDERQKTQALEKHPTFAEKYSVQTCIDYGTSCKKIPTTLRNVVISKISMYVAGTITRAFTDEKDLERFFNLAIATGISARNIESVIKDYKADKTLGMALILKLPEIVEGDRNDKSRIESLRFELKAERDTEKLEKDKLKSETERLAEALRKTELEKQTLIKKEKDAPKQSEIVFDSNLAAEIEKVKLENQKIRAEYEKIVAEKAQADRAIADVNESLKQIELLKAQLIELQNQPPKIVEVEKIVEKVVVKEMQGNAEDDHLIEAIAELSEDELSKIPKDDNLKTYFFDYIRDMETRLIKRSNMSQRDKNIVRNVTRYMFKHSHV